MTMQTSPYRSRFQIGSLKESSIAASSVRVGPSRRSRSSSSRVTSSGSFTRASVGRRGSALGALVLAQQIVECLPEQDRLLLLLALGERLQSAELRGRVVGGLEDHVVARSERDSRSPLI